MSEQQEAAVPPVALRKSTSALPQSLIDSQQESAATGGAARAGPTGTSRCLTCTSYAHTAASTI